MKNPQFLSQRELEEKCCEPAGDRKGEYAVFDIEEDLLRNYSTQRQRQDYL